MSIENSESLMPLFVLGLFETAINHILMQNTQSMQVIALHAGKVIRVKLYNPNYSLYIVLCEEGVQVLSQFDGVVDARVKASTGQLIWLFLGESSDAQTVLTQLKVTGDKQLIDDLTQLSIEINAWHWIVSFFQEWMPDYPGFIKKITTMSPNASLWTENIQGFSQLAQDILTEVRQQNQTQEAVLAELMKMGQGMEKNAIRHSIQLWIGLVLMVIIWFVVMK